MFRSKFIIYSFSLFVLATLLAFSLMSISLKDRAKYQELLLSSDPSQSKDAEEFLTTKQEREKVRKDIWLDQYPSRLHIHLESERSQLVFSHENEQTEIVEHMGKVYAFMQEELYYVLPDKREVIPHPSGGLLLRYADPAVFSSWVDPDEDMVPMQSIRYLEADDAAFHYNSNLFVGNKVHILRFNAPGHQLITSLTDVQPNMTGEANSIEFTLENNSLNFRAYHLKTTFYPTGENS